MMITVCAPRRKAIALILVFIPAACVTRAGFSLSAVKILMHRKIQTLPLVSLELILHCLATHTSCVHPERKPKIIYQL